MPQVIKTIPFRIDVFKTNEDFIHWKNLDARAKNKWWHERIITELDLQAPLPANDFKSLTQVSWLWELKKQIEGQVENAAPNSPGAIPNDPNDLKKLNDLKEIVDHLEDNNILYPIESCLSSTDFLKLITLNEAYIKAIHAEKKWSLTPSHRQVLFDLLTIKPVKDSSNPFLFALSAQDKLKLVHRNAKVKTEQIAQNVIDQLSSLPNLNEEDVDRAIWKNRQNGLAKLLEQSIEDLNEITPDQHHMIFSSLEEMIQGFANPVMEFIKKSSKANPNQLIKSSLSPLAHEYSQVIKNICHEALSSHQNKQNLLNFPESFLKTLHQFIPSEKINILRSSFSFVERFGLTNHPALSKTPSQTQDQNLFECHFDRIVDNVTPMVPWVFKWRKKTPDDDEMFALLASIYQICTLLDHRQSCENFKKIALDQINKLKPHEISDLLYGVGVTPQTQALAIDVIDKILPPKHVRTLLDDNASRPHKKYTAAVQAALEAKMLHHVLAPQSDQAKSVKSKKM